MVLQENILLKDFTTFKIGGLARYFIYAYTVSDIKEAFLFANEHSLPVFILGGGSNILVSDEGYNGVIIKVETKGIYYEDKGDRIFVSAEAGETWDDLVRKTVEDGLYGLENLSIVPGSVGASPVQNIGCYGTEVSEVIYQVHAINGCTGEVRVFSNSDCQFDYRNSFFKSQEGKKWVVIQVIFQLQKDGVINMTYPDVIKYFQEKGIESPTLREMREAIIAIRTNKLPSLDHYGTAGSFFKNPIVDERKFLELKNVYPHIQGYKVNNGYKISLAWVIDHIFNLKGRTFDQVGIYEKQPLALINKGDATAEDVKNVSTLIIDKSWVELGIRVEPEVQFIG